MNTVKYRAWMPKEKKWYKGGAIQLTALQGNTFGLSEANGKIVQLQQWTGLTDRLGVDIFEGDIIKYAYRDYTVVVKPLERGRYSAFWDFSDFLDPSDNELGAEVIGNIYENPELIETKK